MRNKRTNETDDGSYGHSRCVRLLRSVSVPNATRALHSYERGWEVGGDFQHRCLVVVVLGTAMVSRRR